MNRLEAAEIRALGSIIDELSYYQLLKLEVGANVGQVKRAYHAASRSFHPDANRHLPPELFQAVERIAKRVAEAYSVLRDPQRRSAYDRRIQGGQGMRMQLNEARAEADRRSAEERLGQTPQGRQYYSLALADLARGNHVAAVRNIQTALTFEPGNAGFKQKLEETRKQAGI